MSSNHYQRPRWIAYPCQPQPEYLREGYLARPPYRAFHTYGEAWEFLVLRWGAHYDKTADEYLKPSPPTPPDETT